MCLCKTKKDIGITIFFPGKKKKRKRQILVFQKATMCIKENILIIQAKTIFFVLKVKLRGNTFK